jgi:hypothetical protein
MTGEGKEQFSQKSQELEIHFKKKAFQGASQKGGSQKGEV